jgi:hypothetical protein
MNNRSRRNTLSRFVMALTCAGLLASCETVAPPNQVVSNALNLPPDVQPCALLAPLIPAVLPKPVGTIWLAPNAPIYPYPPDPDKINLQAKCISDALERYIKAWLDGRVPAQIPAAFIPPGVDVKRLRSFTLVKPDAVTPAQQWGVRPAGPIEFDKLKHSFPDPIVTYFLLPGMLLPFGAKVIVEGEFPHARFFDLQVTPSFDPRSYRYDGGIGVGEVPIVDADIEPLPRHVNPFRIGANRNASARRYRVVFDMAMGDPVKLNAAFRPPYFRDGGKSGGSNGEINTRVGSGIMFQGPWGAVKGFGHGRGVWGTGEIWGRYYLLDKTHDANAGVQLPKVTYQLPDGRPFFIQIDAQLFFEMATRTYKLDPTPPVEPHTRPRAFGVDAQWVKQTGIFRTLLTGIVINTNWSGMDYVRQLDRGVGGRGADLAPPNNYEQSSTSATYVDYLGRGMSLGKGKIAVLTGKLPTFPRTHNGEEIMQAAQMRYWSIVGYEVPLSWDFARAMMGADSRPSGLAVHEVFDENIVLNRDRNYIIVMSRPEDRPANATAANGVTWVEWGPSAMVAWTLRWLTVGPEWTAPMAPTAQKLGFRVDPAEPNYDPSLLPNNHSGALGDYLPQVHYLAREAFEKMPSPLSGKQMPPFPSK